MAEHIFHLYFDPINPDGQVYTYMNKECKDVQLLTSLQRVKRWHVDAELLALWAVLSWHRRESYSPEQTA